MHKLCSQIDNLCCVCDKESKEEMEYRKMKDEDEEVRGAGVEDKVDKSFLLSVPDNNNNLVVDTHRTKAQWKRNVVSVAIYLHSAGKIKDSYDCY